MVTLIGFLAGILTTGCFIPQVIRTHQTQSTDDFSLFYLVAMNAGIWLWVVYGMWLKAAPIVATNVTAGILVSYLMAAKVRQGEQGNPAQ